MRSILPLAATAAVVLLACSNDGGPAAAGTPPATEEPGPSTSAQPLEWGACDTKKWPDGFALPAKGVECTTVSVPFDHAHPEDGRTLDVRVARHRARTDASSRVVLQLAGGPGGTSVGQSGIIPSRLPKLLDQFDLVYVDQRGTGGSHYLDCATGYPETKKEWIACGKQHAGDELARYLTVEAAHDLEKVRIALGYEKIHVRGGSYGTRLGLEYLRQHGSSVAAMVLDGIQPPDATFFQDFIRAADRGVENLARDCAKSAECKAITQDVVADLLAHREAVKKAPRPILVDGSPAQEDEEAFLAALRNALFEAKTYHRIPRAIHRAATGDFAAWNALMSDVFGQSITASTRGEHPSTPELRFPFRPVPVRGVSYVAPGLYMTVVCAEDLPNAGSLADLQALDAAQKWGGDPGVVELAEACAAWKVPSLEASLRVPVSSDSKVLLLNGELDLNTFPEWGAHAAATLPNAKNLVVPHATHSTMSVPCVGDIIADYLSADGDMARVDTSCLSALATPAF